MAGLFSSGKKKAGKSKLQFVDLEGQAMKEGDVVMSLRYDLGESKIINTESGLAYESLKTGEQVPWAKMIDAATGFQKVRKLET